MAYAYTPFPYNPPPGLTAPEPRHPVVIVGAGPIGLSMAMDLALRGVKSVVLDDNNVVSLGSRAICWAKRYERGEVHDVVDAAKGFGECGFVFESTLGPFVRDALEVGKMLPRTN